MRYEVLMMWYFKEKMGQGSLIEWPLADQYLWRSTWPDLATVEKEKELLVLVPGAAEGVDGALLLRFNDTWDLLLLQFTTDVQHRFINNIGPAHEHSPSFRKLLHDVNPVIHCLYIADCGRNITTVGSDDKSVYINPEPRRSLESWCKLKQHPRASVQKLKLRLKVDNKKSHPCVFSPQERPRDVAPISDPTSKLSFQDAFFRVDISPVFDKYRRSTFYSDSSSFRL
jgi:hypothetical protein